MKRNIITFLLTVFLIACGDPTVGDDNLNNTNVTNTNQDGGVQNDSEPDQDGEVIDDAEATNDADVQNDSDVNPTDGSVEEDASSEDGGTIPVCGDGVVDPGEVCDDGNTVDWDACNSDCQGACGNSQVNGPADPSQPDYGEECDWRIATAGGNFEPNPDCHNDCTATTCGDGVCNWYSFTQLSSGNIDWVAEDGYNCPQDCATYGPAVTTSSYVDCPHQIVPDLNSAGNYIVANGIPCASGQCVVHQSSIPGWEDGLPNAGPYTGVQNCGACDNHCTTSEYCVHGQGCVSVF